MRTIAIGTFIAFALAGCGTGKDSDSTTTTTTGAASGTAGGTTGGTGTGTGGTTVTFAVSWTDDGYEPTDTDMDGFPDVGCDDTVTATITDPMSMPNWNFGMAETGSPSGWYGEDCFNGYAGFNYCHGVGATGATLAEVSSCSVNDVVEGTSTLMDAGKDPYLTYYFDDGTDCFVFGDDIAYYDALSCIPS